MISGGDPEDSSLKMSGASRNSKEGAPSEGDLWDLGGYERAIFDF